MLSFNLNAAITNFTSNGDKFVFDILNEFKIDFYHDGIRVGEYVANLQEPSKLFITQSKEGYTLKRFDSNNDIADLVFITVTDSNIYINEML